MGRRAQQPFGVESQAERSARTALTVDAVARRAHEPGVDRRRDAVRLYAVATAALRVTPMRAAACAALFVVLAGCPALPPPPGDEKLGEYTIAAEPVRALEDGGVGALRPDGGLWCPLVDIAPAPFRFSATVTRESSTGQAWLTLGGGYPRDAGWDGQVVDSSAAVRRLFPSCGGCRPTIATERIRFALMSRSQSEAVGRACPANPLDGGVPAPPGPDGGITGPVPTAEGFDALYACGELEFSVALQDAGPPEPDCAPGCDDCVVNYTLVGERR